MRTDFYPILRVGRPRTQVLFTSYFVKLVRCMCNLKLNTVHFMFFVVNIVVMSRLVYRKGADLLVGLVPLVCKARPEVHFIIGEVNRYIYIYILVSALHLTPH